MIYKTKVLIYKWRMREGYLPDLYNSAIKNSPDWNRWERFKCRIRIWKVYYLYTTI